MTAKSRPSANLPSVSLRRHSRGHERKEARFLNKLRRLLGKADEEDRKLILYMAQKMANPLVPGRLNFWIERLE